MTMRSRLAVVTGVLALAVVGSAPAQVHFPEARIYIEYNQVPNDLGFHVSLDGPNWKSLRIRNPLGDVIFEVMGLESYEKRGMTELFFEGAEPVLGPGVLDALLDEFPEGEYEFEGTTTDDQAITAVSELTHDVPNGPVVTARVYDDTVVIRWRRVTQPAPILPDGDIEVEAYQVLVGDLDVILPAEARRLTLPEEFVDSLEPGVIPFEVLAIDQSGNQTITESAFVLPEDD